MTKRRYRIAVEQLARKRGIRMGRLVDWIGRKTEAGGLWVTLVSLAWTTLVAVVASYFWSNLTVDGVPPSGTLRDIGAVILGPIALLVAVWRSTIARRQAATSQADVVANRWQRAVDAALDNGNALRRKAGMRLVQFVAQDHPEYRSDAWLIVDTIEHSPGATQDEKYVAQDVLNALRDDPDGLVRKVETAVAIGAPRKRARARSRTKC